MNLLKLNKKIELYFIIYTYKTLSYKNKRWNNTNILNI